MFAYAKCNVNDANFGAFQAAELNAMDNEVEAEAKSYDASNLSGLTVVHDKADFEEGRDTILTLADAGALAGEHSWQQKLLSFISLRSCYPASD